MKHIYGCSFFFPLGIIQRFIMLLPSMIGIVTSPFLNKWLQASPGFLYLDISGVFVF